MTTYLAPARVNLIGEHTDYSGGLVLPAAIDRGIRLTAEPDDRVVRLSSASEPAAVEIAPGGGAAASGWGRYVAAVVEELARVGRPAVGLIGRLESDIPPGGGLSSSAALEVVLATALCDVAGFELAPLELRGTLPACRAARRGGPLRDHGSGREHPRPRRSRPAARLCVAGPSPGPASGRRGARDHPERRRAPARDDELRAATGGAGGRHRGAAARTARRGPATLGANKG